MAPSQAASPEAPGHDKIIHYSVSAEPQETTQKKLTVRTILENAGFKPAEDYELTRNDGNKKLADPDALEPIHEGEKFTAKFLGPTPTS